MDFCSSSILLTVDKDIKNLSLDLFLFKETFDVMIKIMLKDYIDK